jgi:hypothetical protein
MSKFKVGDLVEKYTGDYQISGYIVAVFSTCSGNIRYVVEHFKGLLHIYSAANLRPAEPDEPATVPRDPAD